MNPKQISPKEETPEQRVQNLIQQSNANTEGRKPKDWFMTAVREGDWRVLAGVFGAKSREEYFDAASDFWDRAHAPKPDVQARKFPISGSLPQTVEEVKLRAEAVSKGLSGFIRDVRMEHLTDHNGIRDATLIIPAGVEYWPPTDLSNIRQAVVSPKLIQGVTEKLPNEPLLFLPWQKLLPKRSILILPTGVGELSKASYVYIAKGLSFTPGVESGFDLLEARRMFMHEEIPRDAVRADISFNEKGVMSFTTRAEERTGGMDFEKAEKEFFMRFLAVEQRGLGNIVDQSVAYGFFDKVKSKSGRPQGFVVDRELDLGQRGDAELNSMTYAYMGRILGESPEKKVRFIDTALANVSQMLEYAETGRLKAENPDIPEPEIQTYCKILKSSQKDIESHRNVEDPKKLSHLAFLTTFLSQFYVQSPDFSSFLEGSDRQLLSEWKHDVEQIHYGSGLSARVLVDKGIAHEQPHIGNLRYRRLGRGQMDVVMCDWHDSHDLLDMTYAQAIGYIAASVRTAAYSAMSTQTNPFFNRIGPETVRASLVGFFGKTAVGNLELIDEVVRLALTKSERPDERMLLDRAFIEATVKPVTEVQHPLFDLVKKIYTIEQHEMLKKGFGKQ